MRNSRKALADAGRAFEETNKARERARVKLVECIIDARRIGMSITAIAKLAHVTRQTVYTMLGEKEIR